MFDLSLVSLPHRFSSEDARSFLHRSNLAEAGIAAKGGDIVWFPWGGTRAHEALTVFAKRMKLWRPEI